MKTVEVLYEITMDIAEYKDVNIEIEYSGDDKSIEFECARVSKSNNFSDEIAKDIDDLLECGFEEDLIDALSEYYKNSNINFKF